MYKHKIHHFPYFCCLKPLSSRSWWLGCWNGGNDLGMEPTGGLPPERNPCGETLNFEDLGLKRQIYMSIRQRNCTKKNPNKIVTRPLKMIFLPLTLILALSLRRKVPQKASQMIRFLRNKINNVKHKQQSLQTNPWFSGGVEPKKYPTDLLGGLSDTMPREFRPLPWFLKLLEKNRCLWDGCCFWKLLLCFFLELELPDSSRALFRARFSPGFKFDNPAVLLKDLEFPSLFS